ncbi:Hypothetical protein FKW44_025169 [Caligus rogercresseyi]|uniref:Uncharacterized protein n=1 Tax=Caligus rogercresseyi TaxID=217165 RepID=A0A7T8JTJ1_CALRO|nr:Hypothetical protein FKW44_025169 [Caligus rogercresseyi]
MFQLWKVKSLREGVSQQENAPHDIDIPYHDGDGEARMEVDGKMVKLLLDMVQT